MTSSLTLDGPNYQRKFAINVGSLKWVMIDVQVLQHGPRVDWYELEEKRLTWLISKGEKETL